MIDLEILNDTCPECNGSGFILSKEENGCEYAKPCNCRIMKEAKIRFERSGLAKEFRQKTFENYITGKNPLLEDAKRTALSYVKEFDKFQKEEWHSLLLCGQVGAGKTHLGTACSTALLDRRIAVVYMGYREEITALKAKVTDDEAYSRAIKNFKQAPVLFIDDFLKGKITEADVNIVYEIINYRYNNNLPFIISTEKTLDDLISFDEAIGSRIIEMCRGHIIWFRGKELNYRIYGKTQINNRF